MINNIYSFSRINRRSVPFVKMFLRSGIIQQMHLFLSWHQKLTSALLQGTLLKKMVAKFQYYLRLPIRRMST